VKFRSTEILSVAGLAHGSLAQHKPLARPLYHKNYALVYRNGNVDLCDRARTGNVLASFNNANLSTIQPTFARL
jgi:hypothetical protein